MDVYKEFFELCERLGYKLNQPIILNENDCFSSDLRLLLSIHNGEDENAEYIFRRTFEGRFTYYKFLDWENISRITKEINLNSVFTSRISKELLHFAMYKSSGNNYEYSGTFAISKTNEIYKCNFVEYDRFNLVRDIGQVRFNLNMNEFLSTQINLIGWDFQQNYKFK